MKQDLAVILLSTGIGVFIGLGLGAQSNKRMTFHQQSTASSPTLECTLGSTCLWGEDGHTLAIYAPQRRSIGVYYPGQEVGGTLYPGVWVPESTK